MNSYLYNNYITTLYSNFEKKNVISYRINK